MIDTILSISTGNITERDAELLSAEKKVTVAEFEQGYFMFTHVTMGDKEFSEFFPAEYSRKFFNIMKFAREKGCRFICIDGDAEHLPSFPECEW